MAGCTILVQLKHVAPVKGQHGLKILVTRRPANVTAISMISYCWPMPDDKTGVALSRIRKKASAC